MQFIENRGLREKIAEDKIDKLVKESAGTTTKAKLLEQRADELSAKDPELKNLIREYHDGLLLYEISNKTVWDKAAKDEAGLANYFKKNKKKYAWDEPRFKGMAYHVKTKADVKAVKDCVKKVPFDQWAEKLRKTFNNDSIIRIRVEKGIFKKGDNALVDREVFKQTAEVKTLKDYPIDATYGKLLKKGPETYEDVRSLVTADYQDELEKQWVAQLRKKYAVEVNKDVLKTVNNHK
jgi:peptidyl-prolyl cis-trans isomerase SurA